MGTRVCTVPFCDQMHEAFGMCHTHYQRWRKGLPLDAPIERHMARKPGRLEVMPCRLFQVDRQAAAALPFSTALSIPRRTWQHSEAYLADHAEAGHVEWMMTPQPDLTAGEPLEMAAD